MNWLREVFGASQAALTNRFFVATHRLNWRVGVKDKLISASDKKFTQNSRARNITLFICVMLIYNG